MGVRRQARHAALQALFMCDFLGEWDLDRIQFCFEHFSIPKAARLYAVKLCEGVSKNLFNIDSRLTCASENWSLTRMGRVDRAILRLATYEIEFLDEIPVNVAINEAIEVAKAFGAEESPLFVNGVLDKVAQTRKTQLKVEVVAQTEEEEKSKSIDDEKIANAEKLDLIVGS